MPSVMSFEAARHLVEHHASSVAALDVEPIDLLAGLGRVLAEEIVADRDFPTFARATRDGYAVRSADVEQVPARLQVVGEIKAGYSPETLGILVDHGQAASIMTGAPLPPGADAVVMIEHTKPCLTPLSSISVEILRSVKCGENFVARGNEAYAGQSLLKRGRRLDHTGIAIAASVGKGQLQVFRKPRVAVLSTGDELVGFDATREPAQIRNSNSYSLSAQVQNVGGEAVILPVAADETERLRALIEQGLTFDLLLLSGGVSMGKYDLVEQVLGERGGEFYFRGAEIQPGRPVVFGSCVFSAPGERPHKKYFFGLPGNPVSTMVTFELFARPMVEALAGMTPQPLVFVYARLRSEIRTKTGLRRFLPALLSGEFENAEVELARWQGSGDIAALARTNCYVVIPPDRERIDAGEWVVLLLR